MVESPSPFQAVFIPAIVQSLPYVFQGAAAGAGEVNNSMSE
jgi:hypothetical protein